MKRDKINQNEMYIYDSSTKLYKILKLNKMINIYSCGPTVYRDVHVGNTRPAIIMDVLLRTLKKFVNVKYVRNITDIDDKIIKEAKNGDIFALTKNITKKFHKIMFDLNIIEPDIEPKATEHVNEMIDMIKILLKNNYAYEKDGYVFFDIDKFKLYGSISNNKQCLAGARVATIDIKNNPHDFILWKPVININNNQNIQNNNLDNNNVNNIDNDIKHGTFVKQNIAWNSPWGLGRPGWHIECSAMSYKHLGPIIDIHGGGADLAFPHHENEYAQSKCSHGDCKVNIWMHSGMIKFQNEKMSKSVGNIILAKDAIEKYGAMVIRYFILSTHYRQDLIWSDEGLIVAQKSLTKLYNAVLKNKTDNIGKYIDDTIINHLKYDLNTVEVIAKLHDLAKKANSGDKIATSVLKNSIEFIGLWSEKFANKLQKTWDQMDDIDVEKINKMIHDRNIARKNKDFITADKIRDDLKKMNITIEDGADEIKYSVNTQ